jgi:hypothetical protein
MKACGIAPPLLILALDGGGGQLHIPTALPSARQPQVPITKAEWTPELVWMLKRSNLAVDGNPTQDVQSRLRYPGSQELL